MFVFRYLVFCFKIILGIKYHTFYDFEVYWYLGGQNSGYIGIPLPPLAGPDYLHKLLLRSSHDHTTNLPTLTKNPLELILQVFPVVLALAYLFHQLLLRTFLAILHQPRVDRHETCDSRSLRSSSTSAKFA